MDSLFQAAVCDLDKVLDDFELHHEVVEARPLFLKSSPLEASSTPFSLPDLSALHYGSAPSDRELTGRPLTAVDLLSSVDHRPSLSSAPPCPDRALKPVCDLVNDTSSAILGRGRRLEEEEEEEVLLVDFNGSVEESAGRGPPQDRGYSASLSLLDLILPVAVERSLEEVQEESEEVQEESEEVQEESEEVQEESEEVQEESEEVQEESEEVQEESEEVQEESEEVQEESEEVQEESEEVQEKLEEVQEESSEPRQPEEESEEVQDVQEESGAPEGLTSKDSSSAAVQLKAAAGEESEEKSDSAKETCFCSEDGSAPQQGASPEPSPLEPPEFGFEFLPESEQAELLVTDEELDAFLQAESAARAPYRGCSSSQENRSREEEEEDEGRASPESDRTMFNTGAAAAPPPPPAQQQQQPHGGARPKQLLCQPATSPPAGGDRKGEELSLNPDTEDEFSPKPTEDPPTFSPTPSAQQEVSAERKDGTSKNQEESLDVERGEESEGVERGEESEGVERGEEFEGVGRGEESEGVEQGEESEGVERGEESEGVERGEESEGVEQLGSRQPSWVPDAEAPNCMNCNQRFTFTRRRHHCRACGKVYCAVCCNQRCKLRYLQKEARVCVQCYDAIHKAQAVERMMSPTGSSPNPNVPSEYCSTIPPLQQAQAAGTLNSPPPTVMVPVSVLKQPSNDGCPREQKRVWFADGLLPNGEVADTTKLSITSPRGSASEPPTPTSEAPEPAGGVSPSPDPPGFTVDPPGVTVDPPGFTVDPPGFTVDPPGFTVDPPGVTVEVVGSSSGRWDYSMLCGVGSSVRRVSSLLPDKQDELPPLLICTEEEEEEGEGGGGGGGEGRGGRRGRRGGQDVLVEERPAPCQIHHLLEEGGPRPLTFVLNANLLVNVQLITYSNRLCWCWGSVGLQAVGQKEVVFLLECVLEEKTLPKDLFSLILSIYQDALRGKFVEHLDNVTFTSSFLGSKDHGGMLFFSPALQPAHGLALPSTPFLFGLLVHKMEVPWAKVFPLRLLLRLGVEFHVYPTAMVSVRFRDSVYRETGHTIMNLLADLRNYQYSLPVVEGLRIHMEMGQSYIDIPKSSFTEMQKVVTASNEHVVSMGATFSPSADSHLVCFQNQDGSYQTQANSRPGKTRTVTGASFVVFNGALKASSGFMAKSSIVEDGLMVQIPPETMEALRAAVREQKHFHIACGKTDGGEIRENVTIRWVDTGPPLNTGKVSGVDGRPLDGVPSVRMQQDTQFENHGLSITCTEVFYQLKACEHSVASLLSSCSVFQREVALAACSSLSPHLAVLANTRINSLSLRVSTSPDMVEYQAGCGGRLLPQRYMNDMDGALIPVLHGGSAGVPQSAMDVEFSFYITHVL